MSLRDCHSTTTTMHQRATWNSGFGGLNSSAGDASCVAPGGRCDRRDPIRQMRKARTELIANRGDMLDVLIGFLILTGLAVLPACVGSSAPVQVTVTAGVYTVGCRDCAGNERRSVRIEEFKIDRIRVTVEEYQNCVRKMMCPPLAVRISTDPREEALVSYGGAKQFCRFRGGRIPRAVEWESAMRGHSGSTYPWGNEWREKNVIEARGRTIWRGHTGSIERYYAAGTRPDVRSEFGVEDSVGNGGEFLALDAPDEHQLRGCTSLYSRRGRLESQCRLTDLAQGKTDDISSFRCSYSAR